MDELLKSFLEWWKEKTNSPIYFVFVFAFITWNWRAVYILFFESEGLLKTTHIEYLEKYSRLYYQIPYHGSFVDIFLHPLNWILIFIFIFSIPIIITYLVIWQLPKLHAIAHDKHLDFIFERKKAYHFKNRIFEESIADEKEKEVVAVKRQKVAKQTIDKQLTQEQKWDIEYETFKTHKLYSNFRQIIDCIYKKDGELDQWNQVSGYIRYINQDVLALVDSLGLVSFDKNKNERAVISFTGKGKYFSGKYLESNPF